MIRLGETAGEASGQASSLLRSVRIYRERMDDIVVMVRQMADIASKIRMISVEAILRAFAEPAASAADHLRHLENLIDRDLENFRLLEKAAAMAHFV